MSSVGELQRKHKDPDQKTITKITQEKDSPIQKEMKKDKINLMKVNLKE
jgi:hypothetical protein